VSRRITRDVDGRWVWLVKEDGEAGGKSVVITPLWPPVSAVPDIGWKWLKWTFGFWSDPDNCTFFGIDFGPLEIVWRLPGYRP
jgi:hypothetical protein